MISKTFKIGEYARGGIITIEIKNQKVSVIGKEWDTSRGFSRSSNQSNAKEFTRIDVDASQHNAHSTIMNFLEDLTNCYYASKVMDWIKEKIEINIW